MSTLKYGFSGSVSIGNVLRITKMGFTDGKIPKYTCGKCQANYYVKCSNCSDIVTNFLEPEAKSEIYKLGTIIFQTKMNNISDSKKPTLFARLHSQDENVYDVFIYSKSLQLSTFLKATPVNDWHAIYSASAMLEKNGWTFDLTVVLITENVNYLTAVPLLNSVFEDDNTTDVELIGVDGSVRAHGCIMAAASPFFRAAFYGDFAEARDKRLNVPDANVAALKLIKQYAYTGFVDPESEVLMTLLPVASRFMMTSLARACATSLLSDLKPDDLVQLINLKPTLMEEKEKPQPPKNVVAYTLEALNNIPETGAGDYIQTQKRKKTGN